MLEKHGAMVTSAGNGKEAIALLEKGSFDLILMDIQMPEMDGHETATYIRTVLKSDIPIIALSAGNLDYELERCLKTGMNTCIMKPFDTNEICNKIVTLVTENKISSEKRCI